MNRAMAEHEFDDKFSELSAENQRYIIAIQQALIFAQSTEKQPLQQEPERAS